jgi:hypothetical protein
MNLWSLFGTFCHRHGGRHSSRVAIAMSDTAAVEPDLFYFRKGPKECMIKGDYFRGVPDMIAEVFSPPSRAFDRGPRQELYRRCGVPHLWLVDPDYETIEVQQLDGKTYRLMGTYRPGDEFQPILFPGETVNVESLFQTQNKRHGVLHSNKAAKPIPEWIIAPNIQLGLEYFFLLGHPDRRWEIWGNHSPSVLAFGSPTEAAARLSSFVEEACHWEGLPMVKAAPIGPDTDQAEVGRFKFTRLGRHVYLDVVVDGRKYRELLEVSATRGAWDWGEEQSLWGGAPGGKKKKPR